MKFSLMRELMVVGVAAIVLAFPATAFSVVHHVSIVDFAFTPSHTQASVGDTVTWTNQGAVTHTTTSDLGVWNSGFLSPGQTFSFHFTSGGSFPYHCEIHTFMMDTIHVSASGVSEEDPMEPARFELGQNYPNPFNAKTIIGYTLPNGSHVRVSVYDILGQEVACLVNENQVSGQYRIVWDGASQPSGMYFYRIEADGIAETRMMTLLK